MAKPPGCHLPAIKSHGGASGVLVMGPHWGSCHPAWMVWDNTASTIPAVTWPPHRTSLGTPLSPASSGGAVT